MNIYLATPKHLANLIGVDIKKLNYIAFHLTPSKRYQSFVIKKKSGGARVLYTPIGLLKTVQKNLVPIFENLYEPKQWVHGFTKTKSIVTNAACHTKKKYVLNIDLLDFFPSINFGRVRGLFMARPYNIPRKTATLLAQLVCFENKLPQGAPTSPIVSNMICAKMDKELSRLAYKNGCFYTRFADDITMSTSNTNFPSNIAIFIKTEGKIDWKIEIQQDLLNIINNNGFIINDKKTRLYTRKMRQEVTGLITNRFVNIRRTYLRKVSAMLHAWDKFGLEKAEIEHYDKYRNKHTPPFKEAPSFQNIVKGHINFIKMVKGELDPTFIKFYNKFAVLSPEHNLQPIKSTETKIEESLWVLETLDGPDVEDWGNGTGFLLEEVGIVTCNHVITKFVKLFKTNNPGDKKLVTNEMIKFSDPNLDLAVIKNPFQNVSKLKKGNSKDVKIGDPVVVWGFPNYEALHNPSKLDAKITSIKPVKFGNKSQYRMFIDKTIWGGYSGGPVLNEKYEVVGIAAKGGNQVENQAIFIDDLFL